MIDLIEYLRFALLSLLARPSIATGRARSVFEIGYKAMRKKGISHFIFDVDDTLTGNNDPLPGKSQTLLAGLAKQGFKVTLFSNCAGNRLAYLKRVGIKLGAYTEPFGSKPSVRGFISILKKQKAAASASAMIGDRAGADLWGAYLSGIRERILVEPYSESFSGTRPFIGVRLLRKLENR
jgi:predicted HAD superfamily phosphohydrolase YqeG